MHAISYNAIITAASLNVSININISASCLIIPIYFSDFNKYLVDVCFYLFNPPIC